MEPEAAATHVKPRDRFGGAQNRAAARFPRMPRGPRAAGAARLCASRASISRVTQVVGRVRARARSCGVRDRMGGRGEGECLVDKFVPAFGKSEVCQNEQECPFTSHRLLSASPRRPGGHIRAPRPPRNTNSFVFPPRWRHTSRKRRTSRTSVTTAALPMTWPSVRDATPLISVRASAKRRTGRFTGSGATATTSRTRWNARSPSSRGFCGNTESRPC